MTQMDVHKRFYEELERLIRIDTKERQQLPAVLYHYTDAPGLLGILQERKLWATNFAGMNDPGEVKYAHALIGKLFHKHGLSAPIKGSRGSLRV